MLLYCGYMAWVSELIFGTQLTLNHNDHVLPVLVSPYPQRGGGELAPLKHVYLRVQMSSNRVVFWHSSYPRQM